MGGPPFRSTLGATTWILPSDPALQFQDSAATTPAVSGDPIGATRDKSGNGHHFTGSSTARPTLMLENGKWFIRGDGVANKLAAASALIPAMPPFSISLVMRFSPIGAGPILAQYAAQAGRLAWSTNSFSTALAIGGELNPAINGVSAGGGNAGSIKSLTTDSNTIAAIMMIVTGTGAEEGKVYVNSTLIDSFTLTAVYNGITELFGNATLGNACVKDLFELQIFPTALSDSDRDRVMAELAATYSPGPALKSLAPTVQQNLPDASNGDTGEGFTCTGLCLDLQTSALWMGNDGRNKEVGGNGQQLPSLVKLSLDGSTKLDEILLKPIYASMGTMQGVAEDATDNTLWIVSPAENKIHNVSKAGVDQAKSITKTGCNGVAYDSTRDRLWYCTTLQIFRITKTGTVELTISVPDSITGWDQLTYDAANDWIWATADVLTGLGTVNIFDATTGVKRKKIELQASRAIEGVYRDGNNLYIAHDGYYHALAPLKNQLQTYDLSGLTL